MDLRSLARLDFVGFRGLTIVPMKNVLQVIGFFSTKYFHRRLRAVFK
jgi:hypothetical protein